MAKNKTAETAIPVTDFISAFEDNEQKKADSVQLMALMSQWSGFLPNMWGPSIIGFGSYHYVYASGHNGDAPIIGFSPRKAAISLYVFSATPQNMHLLNDLGKYNIAKACIYIHKLSDIHLPALEKICRATIAHIEAHHTCACRDH